jgi:transmembrane 9 superfamily member 2/4
MPLSTVCALVATLLISSSSCWDRTDAVYVSYEMPARSYAAGQPVPVLANKLRSSDALEALDYGLLPHCPSTASSPTVRPVVPSGPWSKAIAALHGDAMYDVSTFDVRMLENRYCQQLCLVDLSPNSTLASLYEYAIRRNMQYDLMVDGMPAATRFETDTSVTIRYWGGVPVGSGLQETSDRQEGLLLYNHFNIYVRYWRVPEDGAAPKYRVVRTDIEPLSLAHRFAEESGGNSSWSLPVVLADASIPSCVSRDRPTLFDDLNGTPPLILRLDETSASSQQILFTYDVVWIEYTSSQDPWKTRWNVFLRMDDAIPLEAQLFGLLVGVLINCILGAALWTWMMRDLSYKPLASMEYLEGEFEDYGHHENPEADRNSNRINQEELSVNPREGGGNADTDARALREEQERNIQLWPLSTRLFFPPRVAPLWLCLCAGIGAQLLLCSFIFVLLFRTGIVNESMGSQILTPAVVLYTLASVVGGYVTARLYGLFHGDRLRALQACGIQAIIFPLLGVLVLFLTYDVLAPDTAPDYQVVSNSLPLILLWLLGIVPLTFVGGCFGYVKGPMTNFPVSEGAKGYQDLNVHGTQDGTDDDRRIGCCWRHSRIIVVLLVAGIPPVACSFVEYAYGVAGPIYVGYYSDASFYAVITFLLFCTCVALVSCLLFYQQIRVQNFEWWWTSFVAGASAGLYLFLLSMSWILVSYTSGSSKLSGETLGSYAIWFAFGSLGASLIAGFVSLGSCMLMTMLLYSFLIRRATRDTTVGTEELQAEEEQAAEMEQPTRRYNLSSIMEPT